MNQPQTPKSICVGIDGSHAAIRAAEWATTEAVARDVPLELVYVISSDLDDTLLPNEPDIEQQYAEGVLRAARAAATAKDDSVKIETEIIRGNLNETMVYLSESAEMVAVGSIGVGYISQLFLGSTAVALAHNSRCPVAVVRSADGGSLSTTGPVVVAVDSTPGNDSVVGMAMQEANIRKVDVLAVHGSRLKFGALPDAFNLAAASRHAQDVLDVRLETWQQKFPTVRTSSLVVRGSLSSYLAQISESAQLVVVGGVQHSRRPGAGLGSAANSMIHHAKCPVLIVPNIEPA